MICKRCKYKIEKSKESWIACKSYCHYCYYVKKKSIGPKFKSMDKYYQKWLETQRKAK